RDRVAEHLGPGGRSAGLLARLAGLGIVCGEPMPLLPVLLGVGESLPLLRHDVDHAWPAEAADERERLAELLDVVAVDRAEVAEPELLEQHAPGEEVLGALFEVPGEVHYALAEDATQRESEVLDLLAQRVGPRIGDPAPQHPGNPADVG